MRLLGIDVGTTNTKAVMVGVTERGLRTVASAAAPTPAAGGDLLDIVGRLVADVGVDGPPASIGVASMAETGIPLDADDAPLGDLVRWDPARAGDEARQLADTLGAAELFAATGVRVSGKVPLATWAHLRAHDPSRWARLARWAGAADLVALAVTGRLVTDHTLAGRTMAYRLPDTDGELAQSFDDGLLAAVGLQPEQLPEVVVPGALAGRTRAGALGGLPPGIPVRIAGHDHQVGAWAAGVREPGEVADSLGTAESVIRVVPARPEPAAVAAHGMSLVRTVGGIHEALVAGSPAAGAMLQLLAERTGRAEASGLLTAAAGRVRSAGAALVLPYPHGRQAPRPDPDARVVVLGRYLDDVGLACAVVDGLALHARWLVTAQAELTGGAIDGEVTVLGAGGRADSAWLRAKAAAGPGRLRLVQESEPVAVGAAVLAGHREGLIGPVVLGSEPAAAPDPVYDELFARFLGGADGSTLRAAAGA